MPINHDMMHSQSPDDVAALKARIAELEEKNKKLTHDEEYFCLNCDVVQDYADDLKKAQRALWIARAERAIEKIAWFKLWNSSISTMNPEDGARQEYDKWKNVLGKCLKKAEEYK